MSPDRWQRIKTIVGSAVERPPEERAPFIESACGDDVDLRAEVERLVGHESEAEGWLEQALLLEERATEERIGPYRLLREIARGGMAEVYLAEREDDAFRRRVAIKLLRTGIESADLVRRFEDERQILASVNHSHIAGLYDGGTTASGRPFLVMEYIEGKPIDQYCDENELSIEARLALFRQVSAAVQFAHQNLVIHRDLKPGNILVTAEGAPKLLDFGIAKILMPDLSGPTPATRIHGLPMTPEYASPEQARGQAVSTASDVYSLGVVLYELLTGRRPYELEDRSLTAMTRVICECDALPPSECHITPEAASKRGTTVRQLRSSLRGDLDNIVMMALRKEPARRYGLVQTFSEDLERHLQSRPVLARRDTRAYRLSKFAQRHRSALSVVAVLAIVAIGFLTSTLRARRLAEREAAKATAVNEFLQGVLGSANPARGGRAGVTVLEAIDQALVRVDEAFRAQPELEAAVRNTIGSTLTSLGEYSAAERELEEALALRRRLHEDGHADVGETLYNLALLSYQKGSYDETLALLEEAAAIQRDHLGDRHPALARTLDMQALVAETRGDWDRAETLYRESLDVKRSALGEENREVARSLTALAKIAAQRGAVEEAEERFRNALELQRRIQSRELPETLDFFAKLLTRTGRLDEAQELLREAEELQRERYGAGHPAIARNVLYRGQLRHAQGRHREALARYEEAVAMFREFLGERHHIVAEAQSDWGECLADVGDYGTAEAQLLAARSALLESLGPDHPETRRAEERLSRVLSELP